MKRTKRFTLAASLLGLVLTASGTARAADWIRILSFNPASPASLPGVPTGSPLGPGNSIEVAFAYRLESHATARIGFYTAGEPGNPSHTGLELPFMVTKKGEGKGTTRFSVQCNGKYESCHIVSLRYDMFFDAPAGPVRLFEDHKQVDYMFKCPPSPNDPTHTPSTRPNDKRPNITTGAGRILIWGSDPTKKHSVNWGDTVKLTAAEAINPHPVPSNGRCGFNVEYVDKETNGVNAGPFKNKIYSDADVRAVNGPFSLAGGTSQVHTTQPYLDNGTHSLKLVLDADSNVSETNEGDNSFGIRYVLEGHCTAPGVR